MNDENLVVSCLTFRVQICSTSPFLVEEGQRAITSVQYGSVVLAIFVRSLFSVFFSG